MNISNFIVWFIQQFVNIASNMIGKIGQITIYGNISLLDFIITITIISAFISIIITAPNLGVLNREMNRREREARNQKRSKK